MNVIARLEFELAYYDSAVQCFNHHTTRTPFVGSWLVGESKNLNFLVSYPDPSRCLLGTISLTIELSLVDLRIPVTSSWFVTDPEIAKLIIKRVDFFRDHVWLLIFFLQKNSTYCMIDISTSIWTGSYKRSNNGSFVIDSGGQSLYYDTFNRH